MISEIVHSNRPVLLIGGGECTPEVLRQAVAQASTIVAADGGAAKVLDLGCTPDAVIGDMDSLNPALQAALPSGSLHRIGEQNSTDFDKCLRNIRAPLVLGYGFLGGRVDHQLSVLTGLTQQPQRRCLLVGAQDIIVLAPPRLEIDLAAGTRVSLYPMGPVAGRSTGLRWPIDGIEMTPTGRIGTSNEALGPVTLEMEAPQMLLILPLEAREALLAGLERSAFGWPAPA